MDTKKLRQKILDLAIHGKLVPQDPNDEPASVLLERIRSEKERLVKEGKIKKSKAAKTSDTPHYENVPFEVPSSWVWCCLEDVCIFLSRGKSPKYSEDDKTYPVFAQKCNLKDGGISLEQARFLDPSTVSKWNDIYKLQTGDVLVNSTGTGTVGRTRLFDAACLGNYPFVVPDSHVSVIRTSSQINSKFVFAYISSKFIQQYLEDNLAGSTNQKELYIGVLSTLQVPIPSYSEQERIVTEIERWFALIDQIEQGKADLQTTIKQAKSKILDLAIHGKLVSQDPNDEPASDLLKRINPKAEITCDNGQYGKMPKGWCLVTGASLFKQMKSARPKGELFKYIDIDSIDNKSNIVSSIKEIPTIEAPSRASRYTEKGDVVFSMVRPYLRNIARITENDCIASTGFYICSPYNCMLSKFCYYLMLSNYVVDGLNTFMKGDNSPSITKREIENWLYPLPPMNEQYRIVAKIEEIFTLLDRIELSLRMS